MSDEEKKEFFNKIDKAWKRWKGMKGKTKVMLSDAAVRLLQKKKVKMKQFEVDGKTYKVESVNEGRAFVQARTARKAKEKR